MSSNVSTPVRAARTGRSLRRPLTVAVAAGAAFALSVGGAMMASGATAPTQGSSEAAYAAAAPPANVACNGGVHKRTLTRFSNTPQTVTSAVPVSLLPAPVVVVGPAVGLDTVIVTFTAETRLQGNARKVETDWIEGVLTRNGFALTDTGVSQLSISGSSTFNSNTITACRRIGPGLHRFDVKAALRNNSGQAGENAWVDDYLLRIDVFQ
jgi:hypothetical protein